MPLPNVSSSAGSPPSAATVHVDQGKSDSSSPGLIVYRRRGQRADGDRFERRQYGSSHAGLSDAGRELALAIDQYKFEHHRRYLTCDEILRVLEGLGYAKQERPIT